MREVCEHGLERVVGLDGDNRARVRQHAKREGADAGAHLHDVAALVQASQVEDAGDDVIVHEKVLAQAVLRGQAKALEHVAPFDTRDTKASQRGLTPLGRGTRDALCP